MSFLKTVQTSVRYRLDDKIATGGYGEVWRATDVLLRRPVAVKQLPPERARSEQTLIRFRAEAQRAGSLGHENITRVYDYVEPAPPDPPFLVMELVDGPSVAQVLACGALHPAQAMSVLTEAAAGLQAAHEAGFVHRDIKPSNLLLTRAGQVKVSDFGVSYAINSVPMTSSNTLLGTAGYVAPERLTGGGVAAAGDLYALGIVAWESLTGRPPFTGTPIEVVIAHRDQPLPPLPASVPAEVVALVTELTAKDPSARPASAGQVSDRAARLRDRLAREAGVSACPLAGPWSHASHDGPSAPLGMDTVPSSEVALINRAFDGAAASSGTSEPPPVGAQRPPAGPGAAPTRSDAPPGGWKAAPTREEAAAARGKVMPAGAEPEPASGAGQPAGGTGPRLTARRARLAGAAVLVAVIAAAVVVAQLTGSRLTGAGPAGHRPPAAPSQRAQGTPTAGPTGGPGTGPAQAGGPTAGARTGAGAVGVPAGSTGPQPSSRPVVTAASTPSASGSRPAAALSPSPTASAVSGTGNGNGNGKAKGHGKGNGSGNGNGNGQGNGDGNGQGNG
jgi:eukaryotic-like serine/threonine-protein kinase